MRARYVLVGFGGTAENRVAREGFACDTMHFKALRYAQLVGATDIDQSRQAAADSLGLKWYHGLSDVLSDPSVDAVYIATNSSSHAPLAIAALKAGKHVIVEEPIATSVADAKAMTRIAKAKNLSLSVARTMVNNAWNVAGKAAVSAGRLGRVNDSCFHMEFSYNRDVAGPAAWRCAGAGETDGPIFDIASHCFYMAEFMFDRKIARVGATYYPKATKTRAEDGAYVKFVFEDGTQGSVNVSFCEPRGGVSGTLTNLGYEIYGEKAVLRAYGTMSRLSGHPGEPVAQRLEIDDGQRLLVVRPARIQNIYQAVVESHAKSVLAGVPLSAAGAVHDVALCAACHASARKGGRFTTVKD